MRNATCPTCRQSFIVSDGPGTFFPFCGRRCKDADLAHWFSESYVVPVETERVAGQYAEEVEESGESE